MTCFDYGETNFTLYQNEELKIHRDLMYDLFCEQEYIIPICTCKKLWQDLRQLTDRKQIYD